MWPMSFTYCFTASETKFVFIFSFKKYLEEVVLCISNGLLRYIDIPYLQYGYFLTILHLTEIKLLKIFPLCNHDIVATFVSDQIIV